MVQIEKYEIFDGGESGRGLRATQYLRAGDEILREAPIVKTLINAKYRGVKCDYCFEEPEKLFKCSKCKFVSYCGKRCQSDDWQIHKHECKCLLRVAPKQPPDICRMVSHLLFKYYTPAKKGSPHDPDEILRLIENRDLISNARKEAFFTFSGVLYDYLSDCTFTTDTDIYGLLCRISCNSFTITNAELNSLGTGLYKTASMINHSCEPNCVVIYEGTTAALRIIRDVECGQELTMSYVNLLAPSEVRLMELKEGYMFQCRCDVCTGKKFSDFMMKSFQCEACTCFLSTHSPTEKQCSCDKNCVRDEARVQAANVCMDELEALYNDVNVIPTVGQQKQLRRNIEKGERILGKYNIALLHTYEVAMDGCLDESDWNGALVLSKKLEHMYRIYLSQYHPSIGLHYFKQGKLEMQVDNLREGIRCLQKASTVLSVSHGVDHSLVKMLRRHLEGACQEMRSLEEYQQIEKVYKQE